MQFCCGVLFSMNIQTKIVVILYQIHKQRM